MVRVGFSDEKRVITIPDLVAEDPTPATIATHVAPYLRKYKGWWVEMDAWNQGGLIHLPKNHNLVITVVKAS
jgi:hypothetical protein